jgi:rhodanese-related sulfurtransferase/glyoxylase-like metal-dependent hydrolase (beta-lactamase superfamily II)
MFYPTPFSISGVTMTTKTNSAFMIFHQFYLGCLSQASYLIGDPVSKRAVVVDPIRDTTQYTDLAAEHGLSIELVIETHVHADFLSGHLELAAATGAEIAYGVGAEVEFPARELTHGEEIDLGSVRLQIRATPGHTPESISIVVFEHTNDDTPWAVLTGDTLFIGDVGRPDLLSSKGVSASELGHMLYLSTREQLLTLPDQTKVFPGHGAGSSCGKMLSDERDSTIGAQRLSNYALAPMSEAEFVAVVTEGQSVPPNYFPFAAQRNRQTRELFHDVETVAMLSLAETLQAQGNGVAVLDMRNPDDYHAGHLLGSVNVPRDGRFAELAGQVVLPDQPVIVVGSNADALDAHIRLSRIGFDTLVGRMDPSSLAELSARHGGEFGVSRRITADKFVAMLDGDVQVVDVRNPAETVSGVVHGATLAPLPGLLSTISQLDPSRPTVLYCASGVRSGIATGVFEAAGFRDVCDVVGAYAAAVNAGARVEDPSMRAHRQSVDTGSNRVATLPLTVGEASIESIRLTIASYCVIDVREQQEFDEGHIDGAVLLSLSRIDAEKIRAFTNGRPLLMVCRSGRRSMTAAQKLAESGIEATNLNGGTLAWVAAGLPIVNARGNAGTIK